MTDCTCGSTSHIFMYTIYTKVSCEYFNNPVANACLGTDMIIIHNFPATHMRGKKSMV